MAAETALELLEEQGDNADPAVESFALANRIRADLFLGNGFDETAANRALELEQAAHDPPASVDDRMVYRLGQWLRYVDELGPARDHLGQAYRTAIDEGDEASRLNILLNQLLVELWAGEVGVAEEVMTTLRETAVQLGVPAAAEIWQTYLGKLERVRELAAEAERKEPIVDMLYLRSLGSVELAAGNVRRLIAISSAPDDCWRRSDSESRPFGESKQIESKPRSESTTSPGPTG